MGIALPLQPSNGNNTNRNPFPAPPPLCPKPAPTDSENLNGDIEQYSQQHQGCHPEPEPLFRQIAIPPPNANPNSITKNKSKNHNNNGRGNQKEIENNNETQDVRNRPEIPPYLLNITEKDAETLRIPDDQFKLDTWETVKKRVQENKLDEFRRVPSQLRQYLEYVWGLKQSPVYGGVQRFILRERLGWDLPGQSLPLSVSQNKTKGRLGIANGKGTLDSRQSQSQPPRSTKPEDTAALGPGRQDNLLGEDGEKKRKTEDLFSNPQDVKILQNDWPYGIDERIVHLVVWTKFPLEDDPVTGDLMPAVRKEVDAFVKRTFTNSSSFSKNPRAPGEDSVSLVQSRLLPSPFTFL